MICSLAVVQWFGFLAMVCYAVPFYLILSQSQPKPETMDRRQLKECVLNLGIIVPLGVSLSSLGIFWVAYRELKYTV